MSGPQFMHLQSYARKANERGQSVEQVLAEASRAPEYSKHVADPRPPSLVYGVTADEVRRLHDEMVAAGGVEVTLKDGRTARRGIRKDRHTLLTAVASHPLPTDLVNTKPDARADYERWREHNLAWLKARFGDKLVSVIEHWDEKHPHIHAYILPLDDPTCSARQLNPAWQAKEEAMEVARSAGHDDKAALKLGNAAYRARARELQDHYYEHVSLACGLTRTGPKRERLSRQQWKARKDAAKLTARISQEIDGRLEDVVDAEDGLERSLAVKADEVAEKLDLADQALEEAEADRAEAQRLRQQAALDAQNAGAHIQQQLNQKQEELEALHRQQREAERADLHRARQEAEREARCLRDAQAQINQDRADALREAAQEAARVVLELFFGVLDGSVRPRPDDPRVWIIRDDGLRERARKLDLFELIKDTMRVLYDAWTKITEQLSPSEQEVVSEQIAEPVKAAFSQEPGNQP
ncbi:Multidrug resistance efflux pump [Roseovarius mucosus DSM 17069]|uniref:Multidrug resistance efflux pump n=1 Tax=Roseovarius mucosus DSM 17069 TaxID=1288298 RepID=A0A0A0HRS6_9RHOB|nr:plasmid recombination protein [Roseovarius mucosus]KGM89661.1 Multidrug resistance efflux pump [Roseovarius mucosus DSM 17069]